MNVDSDAVCEINCGQSVKCLAVVVHGYSAQIKYFGDAADVEDAVFTCGKINSNHNGKLSIQPPNVK